jgi:hypothetical protein
MLPAADGAHPGEKFFGLDRLGIRDVFPAGFHDRWPAAA